MTKCKGSLDIVPFINLLIRLGEIMPDEYLHAVSIGQTIEGDCGNGGGEEEEEEGGSVGYPVMGETTVKKFKLTAMKEFGGKWGNGGKWGKGGKKGKKPPPEDD